MNQRDKFHAWAKRQQHLRLDLGRWVSGRYYSDVTRLAYAAYLAGRRSLNGRGGE